MNEKEINVVKNSTIYEIRLIIDKADKKEYTKEEIVELLDNIALAKEQQ